MGYQVKAYQQAFPLKSVFRIARGAKTQADVVVVTLSDEAHTGWAESVPYARYQESVQSVLAQVNEVAKSLADFEGDVSGISALINTLPSGAARNALDCALWDLKAKKQGKSVADMLSLNTPAPCVTAQTLSIDTPEAMAEAAKALGHPPMIKVKLDNQDIITKMSAIHQASPDSQFIVDANEGWSIHDLKACGDSLKALNVVLIEQPLPAGEDEDLLHYSSPVSLCADESCHTREELNYLKDRYDVVNIKLDKTGGLSEAFLLAQEAQAMGFEIMLGCMVGSSLAMAPISLLTDCAKYVDLDGPLLIKTDRENGFDINEGVMQPLKNMLWGSPESQISL
ncbi:N-acetyl-D-Glu racemase DgcA [Paraglaciecola sp. 20A4]|uniref:N-acetyl-D-Glu racemase DgcA n=1 Tax=Paraglaciecola sp. 20A4 TaxID=2687288 RepID=UPI00140B590B|nr:N-acetyl-D-Glu racemase DgcA [Paraglaciecola sp. 20A4]